MGAMLRALALGAALALAGCAAIPAENGQSETAFALGHDLACDASEMQRCPAGGCTAAAPGEAMTLHIALAVPHRGGAGRFCIATGCEDANFRPTSTRAPGWTAIMSTNDRTQYNAELEITRDLRGFTLRQGDSEGVSTWRGECNAAGS